MPKTVARTYGSVRKNLNRYAGEWVAFVNGRVVEHSRKLQSLMRKVETRKLNKKASVFLVPKKGEGPYVLIVVK